MNPLSPHIRLRNLYNQYLYLDDKAYYDKVRFYEQNNLDIQIMRLEDSLWIQNGYLESLYHIGDFRKYVNKSQSFLEKLIDHNISYFQGENPFEEVLHKRATSYYHLQEYDKSIDLAKQLININSARKDTIRVLFFAQRSSHILALKLIKAGIMASLLMAAFLLLFHQIVVANFFANISEWFLSLSMQISIVFFSILIICKLYIDIKARLLTNKWVANAKLVKRQ